MHKVAGISRKQRKLILYDEHQYYDGKDMLENRCLFIQTPPPQFKTEFHTYLISNNIKHKVALPNRHSQVALAENANKRIQKPLFKRMLEEKILTVEISVSWKDDLKDVV
jgi:hypothetical protein